MKEIYYYGEEKFELGLALPNGGNLILRGVNSPYVDWEIFPDGEVRRCDGATGDDVRQFDDFRRVY